MKKEESKIKKLQKKQKRLNLLEKFWFPTSLYTLFLSMITAGAAFGFKILPLFIVAGSLSVLSFGSTLLSGFIFTNDSYFYAKDKEIEKEIENLKNSDEKEKQAYNEYLQLQELKNEKTQKKQKNKLFSKLIKNRKKNEIEVEQEPVIETGQEITK